MAKVTEQKGKNLAQRIGDAIQGGMQGVELVNKLEQAQQNRAYMQEQMETMKAARAQKQQEIRQKSLLGFTDIMATAGTIEDTKTRNAYLKANAPILQNFANSGGIQFNPGEINTFSDFAPLVNNAKSIFENYSGILKNSPDDINSSAMATDLMNAIKVLPPSLQKTYQPLAAGLVQQAQEMERGRKAADLGLEATKMVEDKVTYEDTSLDRARIEASKEKAEGAVAKENSKQIINLRKEAKSKKTYEAAVNAAKISDNIAKFQKDPNGYSDFATLMTGIKTMQGDDSVVREAELRLGVNATSTINKALNAMQRFINGKSLQPEQRQQILEVAKAFTEGAQDAYAKEVAPIKEQAKSLGLPEDQIFVDFGPKKSSGEALLDDLLGGK